MGSRLASKLTEVGVGEEASNNRRIRYRTELGKRKFKGKKFSITVYPSMWEKQFDCGLECCLLLHSKASILLRHMVQNGALTKELVRVPEAIFCMQLLPCFFFYFKRGVFC